MANSRFAANVLPVPQPSDEEIIEQVLGGRLASFEVVMRRYNQRLFRVARSILSCDHEAEDVLQETYVRAFEHLKQFAARATFSTWLTEIAIHTALARRQRRSHWKLIGQDKLEDELATDHRNTAAPEQHASNQELRDLLKRAIDTLPLELSTVFTMRIVEGARTRDTAACLNLSEANVKVRLHRARALLRERIDAEIGEEARHLFEFGRERCDRLVQNVLAMLVRAGAANESKTPQVRA